MSCSSPLAAPHRRPTWSLTPQAAEPRLRVYALWSAAPPEIGKPKKSITHGATPRRAMTEVSYRPRPQAVAPEYPSVFQAAVLDAPDHPNRGSGRPSAPVREANSPPSCGLADRCASPMVKRAEAMKSVPRSSPPKAQLVGQVAASSTVPSSAPSRPKFATAAPPRHTAVPQGSTIVQARTVRQAAFKAGDKRPPPRERARRGVVIKEVDLVRRRVRKHELSVVGPAHRVRNAVRARRELACRTARVDPVDGARCTVHRLGRAVLVEVVLHGPDPERAVRSHAALVQAVVRQVRLDPHEVLEGAVGAPQAHVAPHADDEAAIGAKPDRRHQAGRRPLVMAT